MTEVLSKKFRAGNYMIPVDIEMKNNRMFFYFKYNRLIIETIKVSMQDRKYHGFDTENPEKVWSAPITPRNIFVLKYLMGENPYARYDTPLLPYQSSRHLYAHQEEMVKHAITRHNCIFACEMGTGKTLAMIETMEFVKEKYGLDNKDFWYVGPKSGVAAVQLELIKWNSKVHPEMMTYNKMVTRMSSDFTPPYFICFDESAKLKTPGTNRSQAAEYLAVEMRKKYKGEEYVLLMSGAPAPKSPVDWYNQTEIACPGFVKEGSIQEFRNRLAIFEQRESEITGGTYPHLVTWLDDENKCKKCGLSKEDTIHGIVKDDANELFESLRSGEKKSNLSEIIQVPEQTHQFEASKNEINLLYQRLGGLVLIKRKHQCMDLPEKQYKIIRIKPSVEMIRAAKLIPKLTAKAVTALILLRELSDGFQYTSEESGSEICPNCKGTGECTTFVSDEQTQTVPWLDQPDPTSFKGVVDVCITCKGTGKISSFTRGCEYVKSKKEEVFLDLLEDHEEIGRFITWAAFTGTIDKLIELSLSKGWHVLRLDQKYVGYSPDGTNIDYKELLQAMDRSHKQFKELMEKYPRVIVVGHPKAGGSAVTLTASPTQFYYSNDFDGDARIQSEDRFHRPGMDENRGATIIDVIHLPVDELVLTNLKEKKRLQNLTLNDITSYLEKEVKYDYDYE